MEKYLRLFVLFSVMVLCAAFVWSAQKVYVVPIEREIDVAAFRQLNHALRNANENGSDMVILKLNTYGGAVDAADSMRTALLRSPLPTVAFVDHNAASAGALIALACDSVFMAPGSSMGAATVVNGAGEPLPEKYQSYMKSMMRATAEHHGKYYAGADSGQWRRNPDIAAAMVAPDSSISFTPSAAIAVGYADGVAENIPTVLEALNCTNAEISTYESSLTDDILGFLSSAGVRAFLIMFIIGGIYMEMHTPGLGFAAAVASVATILYFLPMIADASLPSWVIILFVIGVVLIALEVFVIPGFGVTGITGIIGIIVSLIGASMSSDSITGFDMAGLGNSLITVGIGSALALGVVLWLTSTHGPKIIRRHSELMTELNNSDGFIGVDMGPAQYVGKEGITLTDMRPAGKISIGNNTFDAVSSGAFIPAGQEVSIIKYENAQLYVASKDNNKE